MNEIYCFYLIYRSLLISVSYEVYSYNLFLGAFNSSSALRNLYKARLIWNLYRLLVLNWVKYHSDPFSVRLNIYSFLSIQ
jgi:hypothetical protein